MNCKKDKYLVDVDELFKKDLQDKDFKLGVQKEITKLDESLIKKWFKRN